MSISIEIRVSVSAGSLLAQHDAFNLHLPCPFPGRLPRFFIFPNRASAQRHTCSEMKWTAAFDLQIAHCSITLNALAERNLRKLFSICAQRLVFQMERNQQ